MFKIRIELLFGGLYGLLVTSFNLYIMESMKNICVFLVKQTVHLKGWFWVRMTQVFAANTIKILKIQTRMSIHADRLKRKLGTKLMKME